MHVSTTIHLLGATGLFPSRAFMPAFATALILRFGPQIPYLSDLEFLQAVESPTWFISDVSLWVLGILSLLECFAAKQSELRQVMDQLDYYVKPTMSFLTVLGVMSVTDARVLDATIQQGGMFDLLLGVLIAGGVYFLTTIRLMFYQVLGSMDPGDNLGLQRLTSWLEDVWVWAAMFMLVLFPVFMLIMAALVFAALYQLGEYLKRRDEQQQLDCSQCGTKMYLCAPACPNCHAPNPKPCRVGWWGQSLPDQPAQNDHPLLLLEKYRCPRCAAHLNNVTTDDHCGVCQEPLFSSGNRYDDYVERIEGRRDVTLLICTLLSFVPIVGVLPAMVLYRSQLVSPYQAYLPWTSAFILRFKSGLVNFLALMVQWIPGVGILSLPAMAFFNHRLFRNGFQAEWEAEHPPMTDTSLESSPTTSQISAAKGN
ncbi:Hypothetical protein PBC10988_17060 [Planctomycetales bacterium 10988]|nr:Hypothetical protein PBC10988_17060 [Planctomycetales bacterium 10988]